VVDVEYFSYHRNEENSMATKLSPVTEKFILHWGELGTRWGINRTVAQIHALLYISQKPLNAEEISEILQVARSNVSTSLKELQGWGIVKVVHVKGDRRDHFESHKDVWELFQIIINERKRREIDPTLAVLQECVAEAEKGGAAEKDTREKLKQLLNFFETMSSTYEQMRKIPPSALVKFFQAGEKVRKLLGLA
jgi:DNA-binding transcriptional regulator GbsR (MarR family)